MSKRDWEADWELCQKAPGGLWSRVKPIGWDRRAWYGWTIGVIEDHQARPFCGEETERAWDFIEAAREGWPAALEERARLAKRVQELEEDIAFLTQEYGNSNEPMTRDALELKKRCRILAERTRLEKRVQELEAENRRLRGLSISWPKT